MLAFAVNWMSSPTHLGPLELAVTFGDGNTVMVVKLVSYPHPLLTNRATVYVPGVEKVHNGLVKTEPAPVHVVPL